MEDTQQQKDSSRDDALATIKHLRSAGLVIGCVSDQLADGRSDMTVSVNGNPRSIKGWPKVAEYLAGALVGLNARKVLSIPALKSLQNAGLRF